jgi:AhpD family alkylhydroperoxidase
MKIDLKKIREYREKMNSRILDEDNLEIKRFFSLDSQSYREGSIDSKTKELMGLSVSTALRCNDCIFYHLDRAISLGATKTELVETLNIALIIGGSIVIPHLRFAFEVMDVLFEEQCEN